MNRHLQILATYFHRSPWEAAGFGAFVLAFLVMNVTGAPFTFDKGEDAAPFAAIVQLPFVRMFLLFIVASMAAARLASLDYYTHAFFAPGYRRAHLQVAALYILLPGWLVVFALGGCGAPLEWIPVGLALTGVLLASPRHLRPLSRFFSALFALGTPVAMIVLEGLPRWAPPPALALLLAALGCALIARTVQDVLSPRAYQDASDAPRLGLLNSNPRFQWLEARQSTVMVTTEQGQAPRGVNGWLLNRLLTASARRPRTKLRRALLQAAASGQLGNVLYFSTMPVAASLIAGPVYLAGYPELAAIIPITTGWGALLCLPIVVLSPTAGLGQLWLSGVGAHKQDTLVAMRSLRRRFGLVMLTVGLAPTLAIAGVLSWNTDSDFDFGVLAAFYIGIAGGIAHFMAWALLLSRWSRTIATLSAFAAMIATVFVLVALPDPFRADADSAPILVWAALAGTGLPFLLFAERLAIANFYRNRDYAL